jgi:hypothetical protein
MRIEWVTEERERVEWKGMLKWYREWEEREWAEREREQKMREWEERVLEEIRKSMFTLLIAFLMSQISFFVSFSEGIPWVRKRMKSVSACMPWTIPPVLLVLWSVVWMYYTPFTSYPSSFDSKCCPFFFFFFFFFSLEEITNWFFFTA